MIWPIPLGLCLSAGTIQLATVSEVANLRELGMVAVAIVLLLLIFNAWRGISTPFLEWCGGLRHWFAAGVEYGWRSGRRGKIMAAVLGVYLVLLAFHVIFYLPIVPDAYHALRPWLIYRAGDLRFNPVLDIRVEDFGFLQAYLLADIASVPLIGPRLVATSPIAIWAVFAALVLTGARRHDRALAQLWAWIGIAILPMVVWEVIATYEDDFLTAALAFPAYYLLAYADDLEDDQRLLLVGLFGGLAAGNKLTAGVVVVAILAMLPWRSAPTWLRTRFVAGAGFLFGAVCGGVPFILIRNWMNFGFLLSGNRLTNGPPAQPGHAVLTGAAPPGAAESLIALGNLVWQLFDPNKLIVQPWTLRGLSSFDFSFLFSVAAAVYAYLALTRRANPRVGPIAILVFVVFGLALVDSASLIRMMIAPALLVMFEATRAAANWRAPVVRLVFAAAGIFVILESFALIGGLSLRDELLVSRSGPLVDLVARLNVHLPRRPRPNLDHLVLVRDLHDHAARVARVAYASFENFEDILLDGLAYEQIYVRARSEQGEAYAWKLDGLDRFGYIIVAPVKFPLPEALRDWLAAHCRLDLGDPSGKSGDLSGLSGFACARGNGSGASS